MNFWPLAHKKISLCSQFEERIFSFYGQGRRKGLGHWSPLDFEMISKKDCFLAFELEKNKFYPFWHPPGKSWEKSPIIPLEKSF